jgi:hypothetical protein
MLSRGPNIQFSVHESPASGLTVSQFNSVPTLDILLLKLGPWYTVTFPHFPKIIYIFFY